MAGRIEAGFGRLDALVNKAGMTIKTPPADLDGLALPLGSGFAVCIRGLFRVTRASMPLRRTSRRVVNLARRWPVPQP